MVDWAAFQLALAKLHSFEDFLRSVGCVHAAPIHLQSCCTSYPDFECYHCSAELLVLAFSACFFSGTLADEVGKLHCLEAFCFEGRLSLAPLG